MTPEQERERLQSCSCSDACHYLAMKVRRFRQEARLSQVAFAEQAGIPVRTYKRFESHGKANLETFVQVLRAMERTQYLFMLFPGPVRPAAPTLEDKIRGLRTRGLQARTTLDE
jgi:DNA-binding transcriptional regulator YiaG